MLTFEIYCLYSWVHFSFCFQMHKIFGDTNSGVKRNEFIMYNLFSLIALSGGRAWKSFSLLLSVEKELQQMADPTEMLFICVE